MTKHYIVFTRNTLPQPAAHSVWAANSANAAASLKYPSTLAYLKKGMEALNPVEWIRPPQLKQPSQDLASFYNLSTQLNTLPLSMPFPVDHWRSKLTNSSTIACKYYLRFHIAHLAKVIHSRDWNFVKAGIQYGIPSIYEHHHFEKKYFEPELANHPLLQLVITVADNIRESLIQSGMPPEKIIKLHSGFNQAFLIRQAEKIEQWRKQLLSNGHEQLVVYSGGLYQFKGVDLLLEVAQRLPHTHFVFAGGWGENLAAYKHLAEQKQLKNVTFLGYVTHDQLPSLLQAADLLAHPHCQGQAATFTSPLKLFEYLASGTPIVATEIPPLMEFRSEDIAAVWCEPDQVEQFAQSIQTALKIYPRKSDGYLNNIQYSHQFSWESRFNKILDHLDKSVRPDLLADSN